MIRYNNGNTKVTIFEDGTKIREYFNTPLPTYPESLDLKITQYCEAGCNFCFLPDMKVITNDGVNKEIQNLELSDLIISYNVMTQSKEIKMVENIIITPFEGEIYEIEINDRIIKCTPKHKFFTLNRGWVEAENLTLDDELLEL